MTAPVAILSVSTFPNGKRQDAVGEWTIIGNKRRGLTTFGLVSPLEAEFRLVRKLLRGAKEQHTENVTIVLDSPVAVEALTGVRIVTDERLAPLVQECIGLMIVTHSKVYQTLPQEVV